MTWESYTYRIEYTQGNGPPEKVVATRGVISDGVLHLFYRSGPGVAEEDHVGTWPLTSIRKWKRTRS